MDVSSNDGSNDGGRLTAGQTESKNGGIKKEMLSEQIQISKETFRRVKLWSKRSKFEVNFRKRLLNKGAKYKDMVKATAEMWPFTAAPETQAKDRVMAAAAMTDPQKGPKTARSWPRGSAKPT